MPSEQRLTWSGTTFHQMSGLDLTVGTDSLDRVERVMALAEECGSGFVLPDAFAGRADKATFREWVESIARERRAA